MLGALFRPRLPTGAILALAIPLAVTAGATLTIAVVAVRREGELRRLMQEATASLKAGISADAAVKATSEQFRSLFEDIHADLTGLSARWRAAQRQTATPEKTNTEPAPPPPSGVNGAANHVPEVNVT